jgi:putative hydrolase
MTNIMNKNIPFHFDLSWSEIYDQNGVMRVTLDSDLHIHSTFSDGLNTPEEIVKHAILKGYKYVGIVDHVRRTTDWLDSFKREIERIRQLYSGKINLYSGIEAKVINLKGDVDAKREFFSEVDLVLGAFHRIPKGQDEYFSTEEISLNKDKALDFWFRGMMMLIENREVNIIAHPNAILERNFISVPYEMKQVISKKAAVFNKVFEVNLKYRVPDSEFIHILKLNNVKLSIGSDSHSIEEM